MTQRIGDDLISDEKYAWLRERYKESGSTAPWEQWAKHYISPAGARDRAAVRRVREYGAKNKAHTWAQIQAAAEAERQETARQQQIAELTKGANERDIESGNYSLAALQAQCELARIGVQPQTEGPPNP